jgi:hypothetical protein
MRIRRSVGRGMAVEVVRFCSGRRRCEDVVDVRHGPGVAAARRLFRLMARRP